MKCYPSLYAGLDGGRAFFNAVKEGDTVIFASDDEQDRILWVQAMYRATGQSHKPVPPTQVQKLNSKGGASAQMDAPISQFCKFCSTNVHSHTLLVYNSVKCISFKILNVKIVYILTFMAKTETSAVAS